MKFGVPRSIFQIALALSMPAGALAENEVFKFDPELSPDTAAEPLSHLIQGVEKLRTKKIPEAYFWLSSPQVPNSTIFFPDTKGGAFILIVRVMRLPEGADAAAALVEIKKSWPKSELPFLDKENNRLLYYTDVAWNHLEETLRPWSVPARDTKELAAFHHWETEKHDLFIKIPIDNAEAFYTALMKAWKTDKKSFRCFAGWN